MKQISVRQTIFSLMVIINLKEKEAGWRSARSTTQRKVEDLAVNQHWKSPLKIQCLGTLPFRVRLQCYPSPVGASITPELPARTGSFSFSETLSFLSALKLSTFCVGDRTWVQTHTVPKLTSALQKRWTNLTCSMYHSKEPCKLMPPLGACSSTRVSSCNRTVYQ